MRRLLLTGALVMFATVAFTTLAHAQTTSNGPYYATPSWDQTLACTTVSTCPRFIVLSNMNSDAVLDRETGLVWEKSPAIGTATFDFADASLCNFKKVGGRRGWRVPTVWELLTLVDPTQSNPALPLGHPFTVVQSSFWTASPFSVGFGATAAWVVDINLGVPGTTGTGNSRPTWCVRAPGGVTPVNPNSP
jgi:hypothetical protein